MDNDFGTSRIGNEDTMNVTEAVNVYLTFHFRNLFCCFPVFSLSSLKKKECKENKLTKYFYGIFGN